MLRSPDRFLPLFVLLSVLPLGAFAQTLPHTLQGRDYREASECLEQIVIQGGPERQIRLGAQLKLRMQLLETEVSQSFTVEQIAATPQEQCDRFEREYAIAILKLSTSEPSRPIEGFGDILIGASPGGGLEITPDVLLDRGKARSFVQRLRAVRASDLESDCKQSVEDLKLREKFIFSNRKPLGLAIGMCGRPMNAHYLDDLVDYMDEGKKRPIPTAWDFVGSEDEIVTWIGKLNTGDLLRYCRLSRKELSALRAIGGFGPKRAGVPGKSR